LPKSCKKGKTCEAVRAGKNLINSNMKQFEAEVRLQSVAEVRLQSVAEVRLQNIAEVKNGASPKSQMSRGNNAIESVL